MRLSFAIARESNSTTSDWLNQLSDGFILSKCYFGLFEALQWQIGDKDLRQLCMHFSKIIRVSLSQYGRAKFASSDFSILSNCPHFQYIQKPRSLYAAYVI
jgi:hypothetical protein